jgi:hypothetical protein
MAAYSQMNLISVVDRRASHMAFPQSLADFFVWAWMRELVLLSKGVVNFWRGLRCCCLV